MNSFMLDPVLYSASVAEECSMVLLILRCYAYRAYVLMFLE